MITEAEIKAAFVWSQPVRIKTKRGERLLLKAKCTPEANAYYAANQRDCAAWGILKGEWPQGSGKWSFSWFRELPAELRAALDKSESLSRQAAGTSEFPRPEGLNYLPYQSAGIEYVMGRNGTLLADEMGLGKTIQIIGAINADITIQKVLIVCPSGLVLNWQRELMKWLVRPMDVATADGKTFPSTEVVIVGWGMVTKWQERLNTTLWDLIGIDEAHYMKNPGAKRSQVILGYKPKKEEPAELARAPLTARRRIAATGTPICNRPVELWPLINWVDPINWGNFWKFARRYTGASNNGFGIDTSGASNLDELQVELRRTCMVRRLKMDVLKELPPKRRQVVPLKDEDGIVASERRALAEKGWDAEEKLAELAAKVELARAGDSVSEYQAAVAEMEKGVSYPFNELSDIRHASALAKVPAALDYIREELESVEKLVVFAHHIDVLEKLVEGLREFRPAYGWGEHSPVQRQGQVDRFQNDPKCRVFVAGLIPMGTGFTMTAASTVIFVELDWVPGVMLQAEDRLHRIGQTDSVLVKHLVIDGTIDSRFCEVLVQKMAVIDKALDKRPTGAEAGFYKEAPIAPIQGVTSSRDELAEIAKRMTEESIAAVSRGLRALVMVCDGARKIDGAGFSKIDNLLGRDLAGRLSLSPKQAALGAKLVRKYRRQLPEALVELATAGLKGDK